MLPIRRYWFGYLIAGLLLLGLVFLGLYLLNSPTQQSDPARALVIYFGICVAYLSVVASVYIQLRTSRIQATLQALQTLRTDREYLINAALVKQHMPSKGELDEASVALFFLKPPAPSKVDDPSFNDASSFVLNQYEFLAAATEMGVMDEELLRRTVRGAVVTLVEAYAPVIKRIRTKRPTVFDNLIWLYRRFKIGTPVAFD